MVVSVLAVHLLRTDPTQSPNFPSLTGKVYPDSQFEGTAHEVEKEQEPEAAGHLASSVMKRERWMLTLGSLSPFCSEYL